MTIEMFNAASNHTFNSRQNKNTANGSSLKLADKINATAEKLFNQLGQLNPGQLEALSDKLMRLLMEYKGLKAFAGSEDFLDTLTEEHKMAKEYSGIVLAESFNGALEMYRKAILAGQELTFLYCFNTVYKVRKADITIEQVSEANYWNSKVKRAKLTELLKKAQANSTYTGKLPRINVLNLDKLLQQLRILGATETTINAAKLIHQSSYVSCDEITDDNEEESGRCLSDTVAYSGHLHSERALDLLTDLMERSHAAAVAQKDVPLVSAITAFFTLQLRDYLAEQNNMSTLQIREFLDLDLLEFAQQHESDNYVTVYADYKNLQYNTARKKLRKAEKWLHSWGATVAA